MRNLFCHFSVIFNTVAFFKKNYFSFIVLNNPGINKISFS